MKALRADFFCLLNAVGLIAVALATGCASAPGDATPAAALAATALPGTAQADATASDRAISEDDVLVVDESAIDPGSVVTCRQMLRPASNVIERRCMSQNGWKTYDRALERLAQQTLRQMQGSAYR